MNCQALGLFIAVAMPLSPLSAQVIEIDPSGATQTYSGPTVFTGNSANPITERSRGPKQAPQTSEMITRTALAHGLNPQLLKAVAWRESRGRMDARSGKGALGVMQLMPRTAAELRVDPNDEADNIRGGALYLRRQLDRFGGNVPLALAAYNAGPGAVVRFGGVPPYRETQNYVSAILRKLQDGASFRMTETTIGVAQ